MRAEPDIAVEALIVVARAQVTAGDAEAASQTLAGARAAILDGAPDHVRLEARLVEAAVCYHRGDCATGRKCLAHALKLAEREHVQLPFAMERAWIQPVLRQDSDLAEAFQRAFATSRSRVGRSQDGRAEPGTPAPAAVDKLSDRELEVLRHVSSLESNSEIAEAMYLSIHTVKTHIRHILNKLGVQHRAEAVRMAQRLQLLLLRAHGC
jgi:LuxR family maltose regulon positive regulatory protein